MGVSRMIYSKSVLSSLRQPFAPAAPGACELGRRGTDCRVASHSGRGRRDGTLVACALCAFIYVTILISNGYARRKQRRSLSIRDDRLRLRGQLIMDGKARA